MRKLAMFFLLFFLFLLSSPCFSQKQGEFPPLIGPARATGFYLPAPTMFPHPPQAGVQTLVYAALGPDETARVQGARIKEAELRYRYQYYKIQERVYGCENMAACIDGWEGQSQEQWYKRVALKRMYNCCDPSLSPHPSVNCVSECAKMGNPDPIVGEITIDPRCFDWSGAICSDGLNDLMDIDTVTYGNQFAPELGSIIARDKPYMFVGIIPPFRPATKIQWWIRVTDNADKVYEPNLGGNDDNRAGVFPSDPGYWTNAGSCITTELSKTVSAGGQIGTHDWNLVMEDPTDNRGSGIQCTDYEYTHEPGYDIHHPYPDWGNDTDDGLKYDFKALGYSSKNSEGKLMPNGQCKAGGTIPVKYELDCDGKPKLDYCERVRVNRFLCNGGQINPCNDATATGCHRQGGCHSGRTAGPDWNDLVTNKGMSCNFAPCVEENPCSMSPVPGECFASCQITGYCTINPGDATCCNPRVTSCTVPGCFDYCQDASARGLPCKGFLPDHSPWEGVHHPGATSSAVRNVDSIDYRKAEVAFDSSNVSRMYFRIKTEGVPDQFEQELPAQQLEACDVLKLLHGMLHGETIFLNIWVFKIKNPDAGDGWVLYIPAARNLLGGTSPIISTLLEDLLFFSNCYFTEGESSADCTEEGECVAECTAKCIPSCMIKSLITGGNPAMCAVTCPIQCAAECFVHEILSETAQHILTCHMGDITGLMSGLTSTSSGDASCPKTSTMTLLNAFTNSKTHLVADIMDLLVLLAPETGGGQSAGSQDAKIQKTFVPVGSPQLDVGNETLTFSLERTGSSSEAAAWSRTIGLNPSMYYNVNFSVMVIGLKKDPPFLTTFAGNIDTTNYGTIFRKPVKWVPIAMDNTAPQLDASRVDFKVTTVTAPPNASITLQWRTPMVDDNSADDNPLFPTYGKLVYSDGTTVVKNANGTEIAGHPDHIFTRTYSGRKLDFNPATTVSGGNIMGGFNIYRRYYDPATNRWSAWRLLNEDSGGNKQYVNVRCGDPDNLDHWASVAYASGIETDATYRDVDSRPQRYKKEVKDIINKNLVVDAGGQVRLWYYVDVDLPGIGLNKKRDHLAGSPPGSAEPWKNDKFATVGLVGDTFTFTDVATDSGDPAYDLLPNYTYAYKIVPVDKPNLFARWRDGSYQGATCTGVDQNNSCDGGNEFYKVGAFKDPLCLANTDAVPGNDICCGTLCSYNPSCPMQNQQMYDPPYNEGFGLVAYAAIPETQGAPIPPPTRRVSACTKCDVNGDERTNFQDFNALNANFGAKCENNPLEPNCNVLASDVCKTSCNDKWQNCTKDAKGYCKADLNCDCKVNLRDYGILLNDIGEQR